MTTGTKQIEARRWYRMATGGGCGSLVAAIEPDGNQVRMFGAGGLSEPTAQWKAIHEDGHETQITALDLGRLGIGGLSGPVDDLEPLTAETLAALRAKHAQTIKQARELAAVAAEETRRAREALPGKYPHLVPVAGSGKNDHAAGAANIRRELARAFPGVKFRVTGKSYAGGSSIGISWSDGPTTKQVREITNNYQRCDFDGMQDLETYRDGDHSRVFGGASYVSENRDMSDRTREILETWARDQFAAGSDHGALDPGNLAYRLFARQEAGMPAGATARAVERTDCTCGQMEEFWRLVWDEPEAKPAPEASPAVVGATGATVTENAGLGGVEIRFPDKPAAAVLAGLKAGGWRWSRFGSCWYKKASDATREEARRIAGE